MYPFGNVEFKEEQKKNKKNSSLSFQANVNITCTELFLRLQLQTKLMKQCQQMKQNWTGQENLSIFVQFLTTSNNLFSGREAGY